MKFTVLEPMSLTLMVSKSLSKLNSKTISLKLTLSSTLTPMVTEFVLTVKKISPFSLKKLKARNPSRSTSKKILTKLS